MDCTRRKMKIGSKVKLPAILVSYYHHHQVTEPCPGASKTDPSRLTIPQQRCYQLSTPAYIPLTANHGRYAMSPLPQQACYQLPVPADVLPGLSSSGCTMSSQPQQACYQLPTPVYMPLAANHGRCAMSPLPKQACY